MDNIYGLIPKVMCSIGAIGKERTNSQQNYKFRGIDDLYNAVQAALIEHKVFLVPEVIDIKREEKVSKTGGLLLYTILTIKYTFYADDGSFFSAITIGEAMDSGDKSCNKAMSAAQKYALLQVFCIPTEELKDTEEETHELKVEKAKIENKKPKEKLPELPLQEPLTIESAQVRMSKIVNVFELKNWWTKHWPEIDKLPEDQKKVLVDHKDYLKAKLEKPIETKDEVKND